jgi:flagellar hook-associated protein 1 FlgK
VPSTFFGLEIARKALAMSQLNLQIIGHNIANAGTPGYSRQRAELVSAPPLAYPAFTRPGFVQQIGSGVNVDEIRRLRDEFLDEVIRAQTGTQGRNTAVETAMRNLELIFNEPGDTNLGTLMDDFFAAWQDLANAPELTSTRANLREQALSLVREINTIDQSLKTLNGEQLRLITQNIDKANTLAHHIADLNITIAQVKGLGDSPNDLMDQRDQLIEELAQIIPLNTIEQSNGTKSVLIGGLRFVEDDVVHEIGISPDSINDRLVQVKFKNGNDPQIKGGVLGGLIEVQREIIPFFQNKFNVLTSSIVNRVNVQHRRGFGLDEKSGRPFFQDFHTAELVGTIDLPPGTSLNTKLDELGITAGFFDINGTRIVITKDDIAPGEAISLGELLDRITDSQSFVRASLGENTSGDLMIRLDLYNPVEADDEINIFSGSSNFMALTGLDTANLKYLTAADTYSNSMDMFQVALIIVENLDTIAAAADDGSGAFPGPGNNLNAIAIAGLQSIETGAEATTFNDYYVTSIAELGIQSQTATRMVSNQDVLLSQLDVQRESVKGVNLDEEATNMITYQRIYEGAARVVQVVDSMLDTLINRTGA